MTVMSFKTNVASVGSSAKNTRKFGRFRMLFSGNEEPDFNQTSNSIAQFFKIPIASYLTYKPTPLI